MVASGVVSDRVACTYVYAPGKGEQVGVATGEPSTQPSGGPSSIATTSAGAPSLLASPGVGPASVDPSTPGGWATTRPSGAASPGPASAIPPHAAIAARLQASKHNFMR